MVARLNKTSVYYKIILDYSYFELQQLLCGIAFAVTRCIEECHPLPARELIYGEGGLNFNHPMSVCPINCCAVTTFPTKLSILRVPSFFYANVSRTWYTKSSSFARAYMRSYSFNKISMTISSIAESRIIPAVYADFYKF